jgi:hypothetical protein
MKKLARKDFYAYHLNLAAMAEAKTRHNNMCELNGNKRQYKPANN